MRQWNDTSAPTGRRWRTSSHRRAAGGEAVVTVAPVVPTQARLVTGLAGVADDQAVTHVADDPAVTHVADDPAVTDVDDDRAAAAEEPSDWAWVEEWRHGGEPTPWGPGLAVAGFTLFLVASAVYVLSSGLAVRPLLAILVNVVVAGGLAPALWLCRSLPVLRWVAAGAAVGVVAAWFCVLVF